jgi:TonB-dependent receptor
MKQFLENKEKIKKSVRRRMIQMIFSLALLAANSYAQSPTAQQAGGKGSLSGTVLDEKGDPVTGVTVFIFKPAGASRGTVTDIDGKYTLTDIPAGTTSVQFSLMSYETLQVQDVEIASGKTIPLHVTLKESTQQLAEVVVTAKYNQASAIGLYAAQKLSASMTDGISSDLIKKTSDNNIAQVLKRVAGVTVQENKFVTVRGMSERYNNVQLNGSSLPSTEPNRRNFSFDIIPASLVENVVVNKTFTPDLPGEFTGGLVQVKTLSVPDAKFFSLSAGTGGNSESTGKDFKTNKRFSADYLFGEKDARTWYAGRQPENYKQTLTNAGQMNHFGFDIYRAIPLQNYSIAFGLPFKIGEKHSIGLVAAATYRHEETIETIKEVHTRDRDSLLSSLSPGKAYKFVTAAGAIANIGWKTRYHAVTWRNLLNNRVTHANTERYMVESYGGVIFLENYSTPTIANLKQTQIDGEHNFFRRKLLLYWDADYSATIRTNPDDRLATGGFTDIPMIDPTVKPPLYDGKYRVGWGRVGPSVPQINDQHLMYNNLNETKQNAAVNFEYRFNLLRQEQKLKTGYMISSRKSDFQQQYLHAYIGGGNSLSGMSLQEFYNPEHFTNGILEYKSGGYDNRFVDYYEGEQTLKTAYIMADLAPFKALHIIAGVRAENNDMEVLTVISGWIQNKYVTRDSPIRKIGKDLLPSLTAVYAVTPKINFRAAYGKTLARPDFRELSYVRYYNVSDRLDVINLEPLEQTTCENYDLRLEWYPQAGELLSVSAFYKKFINPVEKITRVMADQQNYILATVNLDQAVVKGMELSFRKSFGFVSPLLEDLWLAGNGTILKGNIESYLLFSDKPERARPLQGLAPYSVNGSLNYEGERFGAAVNYTRAGRVLVIGGQEAKYDEYENSRDVLDLQLSARFFSGRMEVKLNASDILNRDIIVYRNTRTVKEEKGNYDLNLTADMDYNPGDYVMSRIGKGVNYSLSISCKF